MFSKLSFAQKRIVACNNPRMIVKACPGSGKTYSVAAKLARLLQKSNLIKHQGVATLSFTNTACEEIKNQLKNEFSISEISYPNFTGTLDSFINKHIFFPYGHLIMECDSRPEIVGTEFNKWFEYDLSQRNRFTQKITDTNYYFDKVSFDINDRLLRLAPYQTYSFVKADWENPNRIDGSLKKCIHDLIIMKKKHFNKGKAIQSDANYISYKILNKYPLIAKNISRKFPYIIIDEAQDTTEVQMAIIDTLENADLKNIMLIGDPDQAIFEWNTANADLFISKWKDPTWFKLSLKENRRSSTKICKSLNGFFDNEMTSISIDENCIEEPIIMGHNSEKEDILDISCRFIDKCTELSITEENLGIVYRGKSFGENYFDFVNEYAFDKELPWENKHYYVRDIVHGKYLMENGNTKRGFHLIEKGYHKFYSQKTHINAQHIKIEINKVGYIDYQKNIFEFINRLPDVTNKTLLTWITEVKSNKLNFYIKTSRGNIVINHLFKDNSNDSKDLSYINTIHSVKGKTLEAILVFLGKRDKSYYTTLINSNFDTLTSENKEQMRIVYVACSRPRKLLWLVVPEADVTTWKTYLG